MSTEPSKETVFEGRLFYREPRGSRRLLANFKVAAEDRKEAARLAMDAHWDDRLDAADCSPVFEWSNKG